MGLIPHISVRSLFGNFGGSDDRAKQTRRQPLREGKGESG